MKVEMLTITPDAEYNCEIGARTCYDSISKMTSSNRGSILHTLLRSGHTSTVEHASASFIVSEVSRAFTHQIVRHRLLSISQRSQRYCNESGDYTEQIVIPKAILDNEYAHCEYLDTIKQIYESYDKLVELGIKKEDARYLLPNATHTTIQLTGNFREWLHVIDLRVSKGAQWEIREVCIEIWKILYSQCPNIFGLTYFEKCSDYDYKLEIFNKLIKCDV